ncbi:MAG: ATP-dependent 6-phosphofructokinase [Alphaproteobacteria bacterium]|nr:ATP-dependent 6-phosphofructokinase [Alphaproteobacteria bacterium]
MRIGILTGGGDVPGLNPCIKAVTRAALQRGWEVTGFRRGWAGPLSYNPDDPQGSQAQILPLDAERVRTIDRSGGTILHTSRTNPGRVKAKDLPQFLIGKFQPGETGTIDCTPHVLRVFESLKIGAMFAIGGDDTLSYAAHLHRQGMKMMSLPKTMDNDVFGTDYCMGFSTAVSRSAMMLEALRTPAGSHERIAVVELFGRNSGETALISGYIADADRTLISEVPIDIDRLAALVVKDRAANPSNYAIVAVSEGAQLASGETIESGPEDAYGHRKLGGIGELIGEQLEKRTGIGILNQKLSYLMRAGPPDALDRMVAFNYGTMAVQLLDEGQSGLMMAIQSGNYTTVPGDTCIQGKRRVDVAALYDTEAYRARIDTIRGKPFFLY